MIERENGEESGSSIVLEGEVTYDISDMLEDSQSGDGKEAPVEIDPLKGKPLAEVFHFWKLAGFLSQKRRICIGQF